MVIFVALSVADWPPAADSALENGVRIGGKFGGAIYRRCELPLHKPMVGKKVANAEAQGLEISTG
jgi:hypothetical protein